ncbi:MAG: gluconokinase [Hydrogenobacter sp.]|uniref:gluconokinase n=1 Tax=Hydrogenobacter thermophilus TaxID=940 RepID=UPI0030F9B765
MEMLNTLAKELNAKVVQTHASWVLILEDVVYKIKKPVNFGFLDYSTLEKRRENCEKEVLLNKRLCENIYLGVVPISYVFGSFRIEDESNVVEYAVKMKRIPQERLLLNMLDNVSEEDMKRIARRIAIFHSMAERKDEFGKLEVIKYNTDENFEQTQKYVGITIDEADYRFIKEKTEAFYKKYTHLFEKRIKDGKIRDGHGDIRLEHVALLEEGICVFDCIEFNERFRCGDVINDMCFLSMELDFYGRKNLSLAYEEEYKRLSMDEEFDIFLPFFKCYRAYVRGKVNSFLLDDPYYPSKESATVLAKKLFKLSTFYAQLIPT